MVYGVRPLSYFQRCQTRQYPAHCRWPRQAWGLWILSEAPGGWNGKATLPYHLVTVNAAIKRHMTVFMCVPPRFSLPWPWEPLITCLQRYCVQWRVWVGGMVQSVTGGPWVCALMKCCWGRHLSLLSLSLRHTPRSSTSRCASMKQTNGHQHKCDTTPQQ